MRWKKDPYAQAMDVTSNGNSIVAETAFSWTAMNYNTPSWDEMVIYELHVGSFLFDPASASGHGDFATVIRKLPCLADLGINVIHVMPAAEFPGSYSAGYDPLDIFAVEVNVEVNYGGPDGLHALVGAAHDQGIAVIFDVVYNHLGPNDLDLWMFDGWTQNNLGGIYFYNDWRCATPWGNTRPDYGCGEVRQFLRDNALFWLQRHQCDGLRFDATGWIRNVDGYNNDPKDDIPDGWALLQWINSEIQSRQPWKITIAEDMQDNEYISKDQGTGGAGFSAQWGAAFVHTVRTAATLADDSARSMTALAGVTIADVPLENAVRWHPCGRRHQLGETPALRCRQSRHSHNVDLRLGRSPQHLDAGYEESRELVRLLDLRRWDGLGRLACSGIVERPPGLLRCPISARRRWCALREDGPGQGWLHHGCNAQTRKSAACPVMMPLQINDSRSRHRSGATRPVSCDAARLRPFKRTHDEVRRPHLGQPERGGVVALAESLTQNCALPVRPLRDGG